MPHASAKQIYGMQWDNMGFPGKQSRKPDSVRNLRILEIPPIVAYGKTPARNSVPDAAKIETIRRNS